MWTRTVWLVEIKTLNDVWMPHAVFSSREAADRFIGSRRVQSSYRKTSFLLDSPVENEA